MTRPSYPLSRSMMDWCRKDCGDPLGFLHVSSATSYDVHTIPLSILEAFIFSPGRAGWW